MTAKPDDRREPRLVQTLRKDVGRVFDDVRNRGVRQSIRRTFADLEQFYLSEAARQQLASQSPFVRVIKRFFLLLREMLMKLTPARRVVLAIALVFLVFGDRQIDLGNVHLAFNFRGPGELLLILVLMLELKDKLVARDELQAGRTVQFALMPDRHPDVPGWDVWMYTEPANDVGGDLVDHLTIDERRHAVALGDVAGKALPAALLMVKLQATLRALVPQFELLADLGAAVNQIFVRDGLPGRYATLIYLALTADSGSIRLLNAGHPPPLLVRGNRIETLSGGSMALGLMADAKFSEQEVVLSPGDVLLAYSDGVTEAMDSRGDFFDETRLRSSIQSAPTHSAAARGEHVLRALASFVGDAPPHDDVSLVVVRRV